VAGDDGVGGVFELEDLLDQAGTFVQEGFGVHRGGIVAPLRR
jgi:hypothetical protein